MDLLTIYIWGLLISGIIAITPMILMLILQLVTYIWCYIDDQESHTNKIIVSIFDLLNIENSNEFAEVVGLSIVGVVIWPILIVFLIGYCVMNSLRFSRRVGKKLFKLGSVAHDHPDNVKHEHIEDDADLYTSPFGLCSSRKK